MDDFNPYAAPEAEIAPGPHAPDGSGVWCDGNMLVMTKDAELPDRCIKCNLPAHGYKLKRSLMWHPPAWYFLVLFNLIIYLIAAMIVRKTAKVFIPLCETHRRRRTRGILVGWVLFLLGVALIVGGASVGEQVAGRENSGTFMLAVILVALIPIVSGIVYGVTGSQVAVPRKIDKRFVWLKKVDPGFLAALPPWNRAPL